jgi:hypothetical protein
LAAVLELISVPGADPYVTVREGETAEVGRVAMAQRGMLSDPHMSARHFVLSCQDGQCRIRDLGSTNGTFINGIRVSEAVLSDGDLIQVGQSTFLVRVHAGMPDPHKAQQPTVTRAKAPAPSHAPRTLVPVPVFQITNTSPFAVATLRWPDVDSKPRLTIIVKATFVLGEDPHPTPKQLPIFNSDIMTDAKPPSVRFESDLVPFKPCTDVVLVGRAYAPEGRPVTEIVAGLRVGQLRYGVAVIGDRQWQAQLLDKPTISHTQPFRTMDLVYERAFGGFDKPAGMYCKENHVGAGFIGKRTQERLEGLRLPNLEDPRNLINAWNSHPRPAGFGFYGRGWAPRLAYAGTYDDKYMKERHPLLPTDFSFRFFNGAHPDLQVGGYLRGDEEVDLLNVCPDTSRVHFRLPGVAPKISIARWTVPPDRWLQENTGPDGSLPSELPLVEESLKTVLDTLVFVPDRGVFYEVFRAVCSLSSLESLEIGRISVTS